MVCILNWPAESKLAAKCNMRPYRERSHGVASNIQHCAASIDKELLANQRIVLKAKSNFVLRALSAIAKRFHKYQNRFLMNALPEADLR